MTKRPWKEPIVRSIDFCEPVFGTCRTGTSVTDPPGDIQCNAGSGASSSGSCTSGNGAQFACTAGKGVSKK